MKIFGGKKFHKFSKAKKISSRSNKWLKIMFCVMSVVELIGMKIFGGKKFVNFSKANIFSNRSNKWLKIMFCLVSAVEFV